MAAGHLSAAIIDYRSAERVMPRDVSVRLKLAAAYFASDQLDRAYDEYTAAVDLDPANADARVGAARALLASGDASTARTRALAVLERWPNHAGAALLNDVAEGRLRLAAGELDGAAKSLRAATTIAPADVESRVLLGEVLVTAGRAAEGERELRHALDLAPRDEFANRGLAWWYVSRGQLQAADPYFARAANRKTERYHSKLAYADYLRVQNRMDEARSVLRTIDGDDAEDARERLAAMETK